MKQLFLAVMMLLLLTKAVTPATYNAPARHINPTQQEIENYIIQRTKEIGFVKPGLPVGVIQVEGRLGKVKYRTGKHGKYYLPAGVHKDFIKKWNIADWRVCCDVGIQTLYNKMVKYNCNEKKVLQKYNTEYTYAYHKEIRDIKKQYNGR